jgi:hypothetical protein
MHWLSLLFYTEAKFVLLKKDKKRLTSVKMNLFEEQPSTSFFDHKRTKKFWKSWQ